MTIEHKFKYDVHYMELANEFCAHDSEYQAKAINCVGFEFKMWEHTATHVQLLEIAEQLNENGKWFIKTLYEYMNRE